MRLLIITQKVDIADDNLGFFHKWLEKIAKRVDELYVIANAEGAHNLPANTKVYSLGKEKGAGKVVKFFRMQSALLKFAPKCDGIFVHMSPIYAVLSVPMAKLFGKKVIMWYVHVKKTNLWLKFVSYFTDVIMTSVQDSSPVKKNLIVTGHGIDTDFFTPHGGKILRKEKYVLFLGRLAPVKNIDLFVSAFSEAIRIHPEVRLHIVGGAIEPYEEAYERKLRKQVSELGISDFVVFHGKVTHSATKEYFQKADIFVNLTKTGAFDKATLEAMACGALPLVSSLSYAEVFPEELKDKLIFAENDETDLAKKMSALLYLDEGKKKDIRSIVRNLVRDGHNLDNLAEKIVSSFK